MITKTEITNTDLEARLREHGVMPTPQRLRIARVILVKETPMSAEEIYRNVNGPWPPVSRATVYNTLGLFVEQGLLKEIPGDKDQVLYESKMSELSNVPGSEET